MKWQMIAVWVLLGLAGCASQKPVRLVDFEDQSMQRFDERKLNVEEVRLDISYAAFSTNWKPEAGKMPGHITATHSTDGKHAATVDIAYGADNYSIKYVSSVNLDYMEHCDAGKCINPMYNAWVKALNDAIAKGLQD